MRPIARWTVGPVSNCGMRILADSVEYFGRLYPEFDLYVCYNQIDKSDLPIFADDVCVYKQTQDEIDYPLMFSDDPLINAPINLKGSGMAGSGWKLTPPRLRLESHELWIDNDIILTKRLPEIETWLASFTGIISEGRWRLFGTFEDCISKNLRLCAGFFGVPPRFDFHEMILSYCSLLNGKPLGHYDEQGLVAAIISNMLNFVLVSKDHLIIVEPNESIPPTSVMGVHFVGANRTENHVAWQTWKMMNKTL